MLRKQSSWNVVQSELFFFFLVLFFFDFVYVCIMFLHSLIFSSPLIRYCLAKNDLRPVSNIVELYNVHQTYYVTWYNMTIALLYGYHYDRGARQSKELKIDEKGRRKVYLWNICIVTLKYSLKHHYVCVHHSSCINR